MEEVKKETESKVEEKAKDAVVDEKVEKVAESYKEDKDLAKQSEKKEDSKGEADLANVGRSNADSNESDDSDDSSIEISTVDELTSQAKSNAKNNKNANDPSAVKKRKKMKKKTKKLVRTLIIIGIIVLLIWLGIEYAAFSATKLLSSVNSTTQFGEIERMDVTQNISTTGTIESTDVRTVTSALSGVTIEEVNYEIGDMVEEGAVIVAFSREDINEKIANLGEDIDEATAAQALDAGNRNTNYAYNYGTEAYNINNANIRATQAAEDLTKAQNDLNKACSDKSDFVSKYDEAVANVGGVENELEKVKNLYTLWKQYYSAPTINPEGGVPVQWSSEDFWMTWAGENMDYLRYLNSDAAWNDKITELSTKAQEYRTTINSYDSQIASYNAKIDSAETMVTNAQRAYDSSILSAQEQGRTSTNNLAKYDYNYARENLTAGDNVTNLERQMQQYEDSLDDYIVYAPITGMVTDVNAQEGNGYIASSGALMTIQAVDSFQVTTQIDEYDIPTVEEGQRVVIMTDATGDEELEGVVSFISPTATAGQSGNTYKVDIDIITKNDLIKLGMSAKLNIITESHDNVLAVRYDALEDEDGEKVVYIVDKEDVENVNAANKKQDDKNGIVVVGADGSENVKGGKKDNKQDEESFIKFLFSKKKTDEELLNGSAMGLKSAAKRVVVEVGIEGDYYTEISSDMIHEGDSVLVNSTSGAINNFGMMFNVGGPDGGDFGEPGM